MSAPVVVPGGRAVRGRLDRPDADSVVVACPPHPRHGGSRSDPRLRAVSDALAPAIACLRFDYGPFDDGVGERTDAENAVAWASSRFDTVGLFGYSFGAAVAVRATAGLDDDTALAALSVLAPPSSLAGASIPDALDGVDCPVQVVYGERDGTVDWLPVVERARQCDHSVVSAPAAHQFAGQSEAVATPIAEFLTPRL